MPVYEYGCEAGHRFEVKQKLSDAPITICQICSLPVTKLISPSGISFKGAGWYVTDYSNKFKPPASQEKTGATSETKKDSASTEPKSPPSGSSTPAPSTSSGESTAGSNSSPSTPTPSSSS